MEAPQPSLIRQLMCSEGVNANIYMASRTIMAWTICQRVIYVANTQLGLVWVIDNLIPIEVFTLSIVSLPDLIRSTGYEPGSLTAVTVLTR